MAVEPAKVQEAMAKKPRSRLSPWVLGVGVGAMVLAALFVVEESLLWALLATATGLTAVVLGDRAMRDRRNRKGMALTGGLMGVCAFLLAGPVLAWYLLGGESPGHFSVDMARRNRTVAEISIFKAALDLFKTDNGRYPMTAEGLEALIHAPAGMEGTWKRPYIQGERVPLDGWGHDFVYRFPGETNSADFEIISAGVDGVIGTEDDLDRTTK